MSVLASALDIGDTQARLNVPLSGVGSGGFNVKIDDELLHVGGVENRTGLVLAMSYAATEAHVQGATVTPVLDAFTTDATSPFAVGGEGETNVYVQSDDPGAVGAGKLWVDTTTDTPIIYRRNADDDNWFDVLEFYQALGAIELISDNAILRLKRIDGDANDRTVLRFDEGDFRLQASAAPPDDTNTEWEVSTDGMGAILSDDASIGRVVHEASAGLNEDADARWEWVVKDAAAAEKARITLAETGVELAGPVNLNLPTSNPGPGILWNDTGTVKVGT